MYVGQVGVDLEWGHEMERANVSVYHPVRQKTRERAGGLKWSMKDEPARHQVVDSAIWPTNDTKLRARVGKPLVRPCVWITAV